jgi:hypothetical protein
MSKVKIQGNASGTGVLTVTAPNTSTDRTITLPDSTGTILDENSSLPAANLTGTVADARISALTASKLTGALPALDGSNLTGISGGKILQVKYTYWKPSSHFDITNNVHMSSMDTAITPVSASSRLMHFINFGMLRQSSSANYAEFFLYENNGSSSTRIDGGDYGLGFTQYAGTYMISNHKPHAYFFNSASSSTSARTYEIKCGNDSDWVVHADSINFYTIMEYEV